MSKKQHVITAYIGHDDKVSKLFKFDGPFDMDLIGYGVHKSPFSTITDRTQIRAKKIEIVIREVKE